MLSAAKRFAKAKSGLAAVEFALIAPFMVTLLIGTAELCNALQCHQKVTMLASTGADLVAQAKTVSSSDMTNIFSAVTAIVYPFAAGNAKIVISSLTSDGNGGAKVVWSQQHNATALTNGASVTIPSGLMPKSECAVNACSVILAQVTYDYTSPFGHFFVGTVPMTDTFYARPRRSTTVSYTG
jgi:Flp pilus assembly protein TadG